MTQKLATYLRIDLDALISNFNFIKSKLNLNTKFVAVIKAFAYGHDVVAIAKELEKEKVDYFAVAYVMEGLALREAGITTPILVLHPQESEVQKCIEYQLEPNIYSFRILKTFSKFIERHKNNQIKIHLKFNTGLNRLGFSFEDISRVLLLIKENNKLEIASVFSHLVASEDKNEKDFTIRQIQDYKRIVLEIEKELSYPFIKHLTNTSGTLNYPEAHFDMVRIGISLYGFANHQSFTKHLKNVGSLYSIISQIHRIQKGESVGYNRAFIAQKDTVSATIPIGHADGIPRTWGNGIGFVTINGQRAFVLGNVCMDMIMVDITNIVCAEGNPVVIFDSQNTLEELAKKTGTISYEILTAISQRVPRIIDFNLKN